MEGINGDVLFGPRWGGFSGDLLRRRAGGPMAPAGMAAWGCVALTCTDS